MPWPCRKPAGSSRSGSSGWSPWDCPCGRPPRSCRVRSRGRRPSGPAVRVGVPGRGRGPRGPATRRDGRADLSADGPDDGGGGRLRTFAILLDRQPGPIPTIGAVAATLSLVGTSLAALVLGAILLARFPDGRDRGRLAALADVTALLATLGLLATLFVPGPIDAQWLRLPVDNPLGIDALARVDAATAPDRLARRLRRQRHRLGRHPRPPLPPFGRRHPRAGPVGRRRRDRADRAVPGDLHRRQRRPRWRRRRAVVGLDPVDGPAANRDRRRDPALPPLRHRPDHQPDDRLDDRDRGARP